MVLRWQFLSGHLAALLTIIAGLSPSYRGCSHYVLAECSAQCTGTGALVISPQNVAAVRNCVVIDWPDVSFDRYLMPAEFRFPLLTQVTGTLAISGTWLTSTSAFANLTAVGALT